MFVSVPEIYDGQLVKGVNNAAQVCIAFSVIATRGPLASSYTVGFLFCGREAV